MATSTAKSNDFALIPTELIEQIFLSLLPPYYDSENADKTAISNVSVTCHRLRDIALPLLFRDATLTLHFSNFIPSQPHTYIWAKPRLLTTAEQHPTLAAHIKSVRLIVYPFPIQTQWIRADFKTQVAPLLDTLRAHEIVHGEDQLNTQMEGTHISKLRQRRIAEGFSALWADNLRYVTFPQSVVNQLPQDGELVIRRILQLLPSLQHIQPGSWSSELSQDSSPQTPISPIHRISTAYSTSLLLRNASPKVSSVRIHGIKARIGNGGICWAQPYSVFGEREENLTAPLMDTFPLNNLPLGLSNLTNQLTELTVDVRGIGSWSSQENLGTPLPSIALNYWRSVLSQLQSLKTLRLQHPEEDEPVQTQQYVEMLLHDLSWPDVRHLELSEWFITLPLLTEALPTSFPMLKALQLYGDTLKTRGDQGWAEALEGLKKDNKTLLKVDVQDAKNCIVTEAGMSDVRTVSEEDIQRMMRGI